MWTFIIFPSILVLYTDQRKTALGGDEEKQVELFFDVNQQIRENAENYEEEMLTPSPKKNRNMINQGTYVYMKITKTLMNLIESITYNKTTLT